MSSGNYQRRKKESICAAAGVRNRVVVSKKTGLALKTALGLSWCKYVCQKRILASLGVKFENEKKERELKRTIVKEHVTVKNKNVCVYDDSKTNEVVEKSMPVAYITHLPTFVTDLLDKYSETGQLVWNGIPTNEIWVKVGADHGQGSLKMALQVANTNSPNSKKQHCSLLPVRRERRQGKCTKNIQ